MSFCSPTTGCVGNDLSAKQNNQGYPLIGQESIMSKKAHGTCPNQPVKDLLYGVDREVTDRICCFNRHYAEYAGYFKQLDSIKDAEGPTTYYDPITQLPLFQAPINRSFAQFLQESTEHGWPSFRDDEVIWDNVRVLPDGETVSTAGTHLGHNIPDKKGNRYCINIVSISGSPKKPNETPSAPSNL